MASCMTVQLQKKKEGSMKDIGNRIGGESQQSKVCMDLLFSVGHSHIKTCSYIYIYIYIYTIVASQVVVHMNVRVVRVYMYAWICMCVPVCV